MPQIQTFEQGKDAIASLVDHFRNNRNAFLSAGYKEAQVRQNLIDPMFEALGWDIRNQKRVAPQYREVVVEEGLDIQGSRRSPDYAFRVGQTTRFYAEAKKCGVNVKTDPAPAQQLRRYAWSANLPLSVLTDFEEFSLYDTTIRPRPSDKASTARTRYLRFEEYPDCWREVWDLLSREAVWGGAFDQQSASRRGKRGTTEVDIEFLKEIEGWRDELARVVALRNPGLSEADLNRAVQLTIDRVLFLRMAEDRRMERYESLLDLAKKDGIYARFIRDHCKPADAKYNSGLFDIQADKRFNSLVIDDKTLRAILQGLYFEHGSPYEFRVMPVEILGTVYERFLGRTITLTQGHRARIEEKPEVRKAGGVYYTPAYIVEYIVRHTVGALAQGKTPGKLSGETKGAHPLRVLDMACGSGSFLLGAYQFLLTWYRDWYAANHPEKHPKAVRAIERPGEPTEWRLTVHEKKRILTTHIFGVDIDPQAVEVAKLSLLLKVLEGESDESLGQQLDWVKAQERALPNLDRNIQCGNSLAEPDYFSGKLLIPDPDELRAVNPFDWRAAFPEVFRDGGFDCVIGNPPYVRQETLGAGFKEYAADRFQAFAGTADLYVYFIEKGIHLLAPGGLYSVIVANKWMRANYGEPLRRWLKTQPVEELVDFGDLPVFTGATTYPCILRVGKEEKKKRAAATEFQVVRAETLAFSVLEDYVAPRRYPVRLDTLEDKGWSLADTASHDLIEKIKQVGVPLGEYVENQIFRGVLTGLNEAFIIDRATRDRLIAEDPSSAELIKPFLQGRDIKRYEPPAAERFLIRIPKGWTNARCEKPKTARDWFRKTCPALFEHLLPFEARAQARCDQGDYWWELRACDYYSEFEKPKMLLPDMSVRGNFMLDRDAGAYCANTAYLIASSELFLLGILNSNLFSFFYSHLTTSFRGGYLRFFSQYLVQIPIRQLDLTRPDEKRQYDALTKQVETMLALHRRRAEAQSDSDRALYLRQIEATDREIDRLVYALYGLTDAEIARVEGNG